MGHGAPLPDYPDRPKPAEDHRAADEARAVDHQRKDGRGLCARRRADGNPGTPSRARTVGRRNDMTAAQVVGFLSAVSGAVGTLFLFFGSFAYEQPSA